MALTQTPLQAQVALVALLEADTTLAAYDPAHGIPPTPPAKSRVWVEEDVESWTFDYDVTGCSAHPAQTFELFIDVFVPLYGGTASTSAAAIDPIIAAVRSVVAGSITLSDTVAVARVAEARYSAPLLDDGKTRAAQARITVRCTAW